MAHLIAKYTVIKADETIYKDGESVSGCDMTGLPDDFHALQWYGTHGHIEYADDLIPNKIISSESEIESELGVSLTTLNERRDAVLERKRLAEIKAEEERAAKEAEEAENE